MGGNTDFISRGYPYYTATLYVYCDECGSFNIKSYIGVGKWLLILAACGLMTVGTLAAPAPGGGVYLYGFFVSLAICMFAFKFLWGETDYKCRKCGNVTSIEFNTLNYSPNIGIVDVPDRFIQKRYLGYWPDMYDLDVAPPQQRSPEQASALDVKPERLDKGTLAILCIFLLLIIVVIVRFAG
jgi:hypothetical protein